jgi:hypothetical protein
MQTGKTLIPQCFCHGERAFAEHPVDEEAAFELLTRLRARYIDWPMFSRELQRQLAGMPKPDTQAELERVRARFQIWVLD